jgi:hypothetical protein
MSARRVVVMFLAILVLGASSCTTDSRQSVDPVAEAVYTAEQVERIREDARETGYEAGLEDGRADQSEIHEAYAAVLLPPVEPSSERDG